MCYAVHFEDLPTDIEELVLGMIEEEESADDPMFDDDYSILWEYEPAVIDAVESERIGLVKDIDVVTDGGVPPIHVA